MIDSGVLPGSVPAAAGRGGRPSVGLWHRLALAVAGAAVFYAGLRWGFAQSQLLGLGAVCLGSSLLGLAFGGE